METLGKHEPIIITMPNGMKIKGVAIISGFDEQNGNVIGIQYTIPNMHLNIENGKLVKTLSGGIGIVFHGTIGSSTYMVGEPLMDTLEEE